MNRVQIVGHVGADPESRVTEKGSRVTTIRVATTELRKVEGEWKKEAEWHRVVCFGRTAEAVARYVEKGRLVAVVGRIRHYSWGEGDDKRYGDEIVADTVDFLGGRKSDRES